MAVEDDGWGTINVSLAQWQLKTMVEVHTHTHRGSGWGIAGFKHTHMGSALTPKVMVCKSAGWTHFSLDSWQLFVKNFCILCAASDKESKQTAPKKDVKEPRDVVSVAGSMQLWGHRHCSTFKLAWWMKNTQWLDAFQFVRCWTVVSLRWLGGEFKGTAVHDQSHVMGGERISVCHY